MIEIDMEGKELSIGEYIGSEVIVAGIRTYMRLSGVPWLPGTLVPSWSMSDLDVIVIDKEITHIFNFADGAITL